MTKHTHLNLEALYKINNKYSSKMSNYKRKGKREPLIIEEQREVRARYNVESNLWSRTEKKTWKNIVGNLVKEIVEFE